MKLLNVAAVAVPLALSSVAQADQYQQNQTSPSSS